MEILSTRPSCLTLEARHTISLEVAKKRRLRVASSLFLPKKIPKTNQTTLEDDMNPQATESPEKMKTSPRLGSDEASATKDSTRSSSRSRKTVVEKSVFSKNLSFSNEASTRKFDDKTSRPYDPRVSSSSWGNQFQKTNKYTSQMSGRTGPTKAEDPPMKSNTKASKSSSHSGKRQSNRSRKDSSILAGAGPPKRSAVSVMNTSQIPGSSPDAPSEQQIAHDTSTQTHQRPCPSAIKLAVINDDSPAKVSAPPVAVKNTDRRRQHASTQTQTPSKPPVVMINDETVAYAPETSANESQISFPLGQPINNQDQQITWQISIPTLGPPLVPDSSTPKPAVHQPEITPKRSAVKNPSKRAHIPEANSGVYPPPGENSPCQQPPAPEPTRAAPPKRTNRTNQTARKSADKTKRQEAQNPENIYQRTYQHPYPPYEPPKPVYAQQLMYYVCPSSANHPMYSNENCHSYGHPNMIPPNHMAPEIRYRPYQCISRPPVMYHPVSLPMIEPPSPQSVSSSKLPASLSPADMAKWLASRYQPAAPQPQQEYVSIADYPQGLVQYAMPPQNKQNFMNTFYEQYAQAAQSGTFCDNPARQTSQAYYSDNRPPMRNYGLPKMADAGNHWPNVMGQTMDRNSGPSNCRSNHQGYYPGGQPGMNCSSSAPMYSVGHMGHSHTMPSSNSRHVHFAPTAMRFPNHDQQPIDSEHIPSNISPAMGGLSINDQIPEEFYRNMMNIPEYDPRDNR